MKVTLDESGYVNGWCMVGDNGGIDVDVPEDFDSFLDRFEGFKLVDGKLVLDKEKEDANRLNPEKAGLRARRESECFSVVNRGWLWYSCLSTSEWQELRSWYLAWLNVTNTMTVPERPSWIDSLDTSKIPLTPFGIV